MFVYILLGGICQQSKNRISIPFCNVVYFLHYSFLIKKMWAVLLGQKCIGPSVISPYLPFWVQWKGSPLPKQNKHFSQLTISVKSYLIPHNSLAVGSCRMQTYFKIKYCVLVSRKNYHIVEEEGNDFCPDNGQDSTLMSNVSPKISIDDSWMETVDVDLVSWFLQSPGQFFGEQNIGKFRLLIGLQWMIFSLLPIDVIPMNFTTRTSMSNRTDVDNSCSRWSLNGRRIK